MKEASRRVKQLLEAISLTQDEEIDCSTCLDLVPIYVDRELAGADAARELPALRQHLAVCRECLEEYEALRDLALLEAAGGLPDRDELLRELRRQRPED